MKIAVSQDHYTYIADLINEDGEDLLPPIDKVVDSCLYLLSLVYPGKEVEMEARQWEI